MAPASKAPGLLRLQRVLADAGVAARRACEEMIEAGRVAVNGEVVRRLPVFVDPRTDQVSVDGRPVRAPARHVYVMLNKPADTLVTGADEPGLARRTVMHLVDHPAAPRLYPVGRLDFASTGLVLLTNDGELANRLTHPRFGVTKTYHITVRSGIDASALAAIGAKLRAAPEGEARRGPRGPMGRAPDLSIVRQDSSKAVIEVTLREAQNRRLRDVLKHLGMPVRRLERVAIGPVRLAGLAPGRWRELTRDEVRLLRSAGRAAARGQTRAGGSPINTRAGRARPG
jgi:23S rRNA pseudouridine2605 synthase